MRGEWKVGMKKGTLRKLRVPVEFDGNYFLPRMESFAAFATRNFTTFLAGI